MTLKKFRLIIASIILLFFLLIFFIGAEQFGYLKYLVKLQFTSALLLLTISPIFLLLIILLTLILGRVYCSVLCPLGLLQDLMIRINKIVAGLTGKFPKTVKNEREIGEDCGSNKSWNSVINTYSVKVLGKEYRRGNTAVRVVFLIIYLFGIISGFSLIITLLDPYSNFGRIISNLFKPVIAAVNNTLVTIINNFNLYWLSEIKYSTAGVMALGLIIIYLIMLIIMVIFRDRLYCNTVCPVGTILGFVSKLSFFKIRIDEDKCSSCGLCERVCKSSCINSKEKKIDNDRCINCYNCLDACKIGAVTYSSSGKLKKNVKLFSNNKSRKKQLAGDINQEQDKDLPEDFLVGRKVNNGQNDRIKDRTKRNFIRKSIYTTAGLFLFRYKKVLAVEKRNKRPVMPPGADNIDDFNRLCTGCHLCVGSCPSNVLEPAFLEYGLAGLFQPHLNFQNRYCEYECNNCSQVCPVNAIRPISLEEKKKIQIGTASFEKEKCVVYEKGTACGACDEHCPTKAVHLVPFKNGLKIPEVDQERCIGCGACEHSCPVAGKAIWVSGNKVHKIAKQMEKGEKMGEEINPNFDEFPF